ncbi:Kinetochore protein Spc24 [Entomophthora muscae]|uniref:Kinetochore protein Spc24 n=1 Tax=Entomophthora muscae TaxID=34485 RepID=A0ACC2SJ31_9FUNG|nr:Kinetochore protein Spc24 [Entomophthora muscae]
MSDTEFEIKINSKFAEEYERRKKEEDLNTIKEKFQGEEVDEERLLKIYERQRRYGTDNPIGTDGVNIKVDAEDSEESDSEIEDEQAALITPEVDSQILKTIVLLKTKNADIYDPSKKFFDEKAIEEARERLQKRRSRMPMRLL